MLYYPRRAAATNLITNGGFETNTTGWTPTSGTTLTRITSDAVFGSACLRAVSGTGTQVGSRLRVDTGVDDSPSTFFLDGAQAELGSIATPYIETDGGTATRSAGPNIATPSSSLLIPVGRVS